MPNADIDELATLYRACRQTRADHEEALRELQDADERLASMERLAPWVGLDPRNIQAFNEEKSQRELFVQGARQRLVDADFARNEADNAYDTAAEAAPPLWDEDGDLPLLLLPLRLETVYRPAGAGAELWIRAYPDDVHVDGHEVGLTPREQAAGEEYRRAAQEPDPEAAAVAWRELVRELGPSRAAWVRERMRPGAPAPDGDSHSRTGTWTRAPHTELMPDHLVFSGYREGRLAWRTEGAPIPSPLPVSFAPPGSDVAPADPDLPWDEGCHWLVDFDAAVAAGMAVRVPLADPDLHYDLITVAGARTDDSALDGARRCENLLIAHTYTDGLAVLPAGTPTNNTSETRSGWRSRPEPRSPEEIDRLREEYLPDSTQPASRVARALGIDGHDSLALAPDALVDDEAVIARVNAMIGRWFTHSPDFRSPSDRLFPALEGYDFLVDHFGSYVRSRGPLPTLRVGRQPYGLLPAGSLTLWRGDDVAREIVTSVASVHDAFALRVPRAPRLGSGPDQDAVLLDLLSRRPASRRVRRSNKDPVNPKRTAATPATIGVVGAGSTFAHRGPQAPPRTEIAAAFDPTPEMLGLVADRPLTALAAIATHGLDMFTTWDPATEDMPDLAFLRPERDQIKARLAPLVDSDAAGLLYALGVPILLDGIFSGFFAGFVTQRLPEDPEIVERWRAMLSRHANLADDVVFLEQLAESDLPLVEQLLCESLDTTAHRLDAWVTSLATARLDRTREDRPAGLRTGAYGWLVDVAPMEPDHRTAGDGYLVAPSLHHATTAAVLRSGWLAHSNREAFAVNLTSRRVRLALSLVDGVRSGQDLAALLGYRFERRLHDAGLDRWIASFRERYPLAPLADPEGEGAADARTAVAARNVVDGQALRRARLAFDSEEPPLAAEDDQLETIRMLIAELDDAVDALGDLLLAESVHHLVGGNPLRAGLAADAIGRGEGLPEEFEVVTTPRSGNDITHAVGFLTPAAGAAGGGGWSDTSALAILEPRLEQWCRARLGPADQWRFTFPVGGGAADSPVSLAALDVSALQVVLSATPGATSPLMRLLRRAGGVDPAQGLADEAGDSGGRYGELAALTGSLRAVLATSHPLLAPHLDPTVADPWAAADLDDLATRIGSWLARVRAAADALGPQAEALAGASAGAGQQAAAEELLRTLDMLAGAGFIPAAADGPLPRPSDGGTDPSLLVVQALRIRTALADLGLPGALQPPPSGDQRTATTALAWVTAVTQLVRRVVGDAIPLVPVLNLSGDAAARAAAATLDPSHRPEGADDEAVADWLRELSQVRSAVSDLDEALLGSQVMAGSRPPGFIVAQSPATAAHPPWAARSALGSGRSAVRSCCVLAADSTDGGLDPRSVAGLVTDTWTELVPSQGRERGTAEEIAAIAFKADRPGARAPHALLLAVPPDRSRGWRMQDVHAVIEETFDLTRIRPLDLGDLPEMRGPLPLEAPFTMEFREL